MTKSNVINPVNSANQRENSIGGRTTISPPAKICKEDQNTPKVLASNIDTLVLSLYIKWKNQYFFSSLDEAKSIAQIGKSDYSLPFVIDEKVFEEYAFDVKPHGSQGYEWILNNSEYSLLVGNWIFPQSRPSIMITIRSETLWYKGPRQAVHFITSFLKKFGAEIDDIKVSRIDPCVDLLIPENKWNEDILKYKVTRATADKTFRSHKNLDGIMIGKGMISARLYDKPQEIKQQSNKTWFYDIWGFNEVPKNFKIIRIEFQLRREIIKQLGIKHVHNLFDLIQEIWAYCTKEWLKFQNNPEKQSHQRKILDWWRIVQNGFNNIPAGSPLVRRNAIKADQNKICLQTIGFLSSFAALELQNGFRLDAENINLIETFDAFRKYVIENNLMQERFSELVTNKKAKYQRLRKETLDLIRSQASKNAD